MIPLRLHRSCRRARRGAAAVEFAITAPILFGLVFGAIEVGRGLMVQQLLSNAARDGARAAMLEGATATAVETAVTDYLTQSDVTDVSVTVSPNPISLAQGGDPVQVTVQVPFNSVSWLSPVRFLNDITLSATVTMRREVFTSTSENSESGGETLPPESL